MYFGYIREGDEVRGAAGDGGGEGAKVRRRRDVLKLLALRLVAVESQWSKARCYIEMSCVHLSSENIFLLFFWQVLFEENLSF